MWASCLQPQTSVHHRKDLPTAVLIRTYRCGLSHHRPLLNASGQQIVLASSARSDRMHSALDVRCSSTAEALSRATQQLQRAQTKKDSDSARSAWNQIKRLLEHPHTFEKYTNSIVIGSTSLANAVLTALAASWGFPAKFQDRLGMERLAATAAALYSRDPESMTVPHRVVLARECREAAGFAEGFSAAMKAAADLVSDIACSTAPIQRAKQLRSSTSLLQLFLNIARVWPGNAGLLNSKEVRAAASAAAELAAQLIAAAPNGHDLAQRAGDIEQQDIERLLQPAVQVACLLAKQLHSRLDLIAEGAPDDELLESPAFLHLMLLLLDIQLQQHLSQQGVAQSLADAGPSASGGPPAAPEAAAATAADGQYLQQYHLVLQVSIGGPTLQLYQLGTAAAQEVQLTLPMILELLTCMMHRVGEQYDNWDEYSMEPMEGDLVDKLCGTVVQPLLQAMVHVAVSEWKVGDLQTAMKAADLAMKAGWALQWWSHIEGCKREAVHKDDDQQAALGAMQHILIAVQCLLEAAPDGGTSGEQQGLDSGCLPPSSSSTDETRDSQSHGLDVQPPAVQEQLPQLLAFLLKAGSSMTTTMCNLTQTEPATVGSVPAVLHKRLYAAAEECIRSLAAAAARGAIRPDEQQTTEIARYTMHWIVDKVGLVGSVEEAHAGYFNQPTWHRAVSETTAAAAAGSTVSAVEPAAEPAQAAAPPTCTEASAQASNGNGRGVAEQIDSNGQTAATVQAAATVGACHCSDRGKSMFSVLLSHLKLAAALQESSYTCSHSSTAATNSVRQAAAAAIGSLAIGQQPPAAAQLPAAVPWLLLMMRSFIVDIKHVIHVAKQVQLQWTQKQQQQAVPSPTAPVAACSDAGCASTVPSAGPEQKVPTQKQWQLPAHIERRLLNMGDWLHAVENLSTMMHVWLRPYTTADGPKQRRQQQQDASCEEPPASGDALLHVQLAQLLHTWEQHLLPAVKQSQPLIQYLSVPVGSCYSTGYPQTLKQLMIADAAAIADAAVNDEGAYHVVVASEQYRLPLLQRLEAAAKQLCALLPVPLCCNNTECMNVSSQSELLLVAGKGCICAGCEVARYCGRECQAAHWQQHKKVCRMINNSRTT